MMENSQRNVVNLSQFDKARKLLSPAEVLLLLNECRDRLMAAVEQVWNEKRGQIENDLLDLAENSPILENRNLYYQAQGLLRNRSESLTGALRTHYIATVDAQVRGSHDTASSSAEFSSDLDLSLVDETAFEESLALSKSASRMQMDAVEELAALEQRIAALLRHPNGKNGASPFAPKDLCEAFLAACKELETNSRVRLILLQHFDSHIAPVLPKTYQAINQFLVAKGILPSIKVGMSSTRERNRTVRPNHDAAVPAAFTTGAETGINVDNVDVFAVLQQLLSRQMSQVPQGHWASQGGADGADGMFRSPAQITANQIASLTLLQRGQFSGNDSFAFDPALIQAGTTNVLRDIRDAGLVQAATRADDFVIDIVAMLFDYVFDDENIPAALKALIGRLQIPVLKIAMLDRQFFSKKAHPARRLLDEMASAAVGWTETGEYNAALYAKMSDIVQSILNDFAEDASVFGTLLHDLETFIATHEIEAQTAVNETAQIIESAERAQVAAVIVQEIINREFRENNSFDASGHEEQVYPDLIIEFVHTTWQRVLLHVYIQESEQSPVWQGVLKTMRDLLWSVTPKLNTEDRLGLVSMLPELLKQLRDGMNLIQVDVSQREVIFSGLVSCHAVAVKAGLQSSARLQGAEAAAYSSALQHAATKDERAIDTIDEVTEHFDFAVDPVESLDEDEYTEQARALKKGMWLEFTNADGESHPARLSWVSSLRGVYLFTNNQGLNAITIALPRLAARLRGGEARVIKTTSLTERAVDRLIGKLQGRGH
ncbi:MAG: DUF1631 domain-containing protein [Sulfuriferula sp.]